MPPRLCELDSIPSKILFDNIYILLPTITHIVDVVLVPHELKIAVVKPLLKRLSLDKKNLLKQYRPISNLRHSCLENVVLNQLLCHLRGNNLGKPLQSAHLTEHKTETVLLLVVNGRLTAVNDYKMFVLPLLDSSVCGI